MNFREMMTEMVWNPVSLTEPPRDIVVIGASRGGVEALEAIVAALPPNLQSTLLIVLHIRPTHASLLPDILSRAGPLPAEHGRNGVRIARVNYSDRVAARTKRGGRGCGMAPPHGKSAIITAKAVRRGLECSLGRGWGLRNDRGALNELVTRLTGDRRR
jgi:hypothetical protein